MHIVKSHLLKWCLLDFLEGQSTNLAATAPSPVAACLLSLSLSALFHPISSCVPSPLSFYLYLLIIQLYRVRETLLTSQRVRAHCGHILVRFKPCPHCHRKRQLSHKTATVALFGDCRRKRRLSPNSASVTVTENGDCRQNRRHHSRRFLDSRRFVR